ncbi:MAG: hypothetical protein IJ555_04300 [Ruminococcus sp.]|nr:hypothetical protein [Ruminococcus sp.]
MFIADRISAIIKSDDISGEIRFSDKLAGLKLRDALSQLICDGSKIEKRLSQLTLKTLRQIFEYYKKTGLIKDYRKIKDPADRRKITGNEIINIC